MPTKATGPLQEDYNRAIRATISNAKRYGVGVVRVEVGQVAIVIPLDGPYMEQMARGHLPAPEKKLPAPRW